MSGGVERATPVAGRGGRPPPGTADAGTGWRELESTVGTGSGGCRVLHADLVTSGTWGSRTGAGDGGQARCDEAADGQAERSARGARAIEGRRIGSYAGGGREPGTAGRPETRHCGGVAESQGGIKQAGSPGRNQTHLAQHTGGTDKEGARPRTFVAVRSHRDRRERQEADLALACGCGTAPPTGKDSARASGAVHGST